MTTHVKASHKDPAGLQLLAYLFLPIIVVLEFIAYYRKRHGLLGSVSTFLSATAGTAAAVLLVRYALLGAWRWAGILLLLYIAFVWLTNWYSSLDENRTEPLPERLARLFLIGFVIAGLWVAVQFGPAM